MNDYEFLEKTKSEINKLIEKYDPEGKGKCHTIANLIGSYFNVHFNSDLTHFANRAHGWIANNRFSFEIINNGSNIILSNDISYSLYLEGTELPLLGTDLAKKVKDPINEKKFIEYLDNNFNKVDEKVVKAGYYRVFPYLQGFRQHFNENIR